MANKHQYDIGVVISADANRATSEIRKVDGAMGKMGTTAKNAMASFAGNVAANAFGQISSLATSGAVEIARYSAKIETATVAIKNLSGSAAFAVSHIKDLQAFSLKNSLPLEPLLTMSQRLQSAGVNSEKLVPLLQDIGNVAAATGDLGAERLEGISVALSQMISKGKLSAEEMEQLSERGVPAWKLLSDATGKTVAELRKLGEQGKLTSDDMLKALNKIASTKYGNAMKEQAETGMGAMIGLENAIKVTASKAFEPIYKEFSEIAVKANKEIQAQGGDLEAVGKVLGKYIAQGFGVVVRESFITLGKMAADSFISQFARIPDMLRGIFEFNIQKTLENLPILGEVNRISREIADGAISKYKYQTAVSSEGRGNSGYGVQPIAQKTAAEILAETRKKNNVKNSIPNIASGGGSKVGGKSNAVEQEMRRTFEELGFTVVRTFGKAINKGSLHPLGKAIDLSVKQKSTEQLFEAAIVGIQKGWQLVDERVPRTGKGGKKIKQTGPHFHFEKDGGKDPSLFLDAKYYGGQSQLDYLKKLDAERIAGKGGLSDFQKEQNEQRQIGIDLLKQYDDQLARMNATTVKENLLLDLQDEKYKTLNPEIRAAAIAKAELIDEQIKAAKASEAFTSFTQKLTEQYQELIKVEMTATESLENHITALKDAGVILDDYGNNRLRFQAWAVDFEKSERSITEAIEEQTRAYRENRDAMFEMADAERQLKNLERASRGLPEIAGGVRMPNTSTRERVVGDAPKMKRKISAFDVRGLGNQSDYAAGGIFDPKTIDTQVSALQTLKEVGMDTFGSMAGAIGQATANWLAYGDAAGQSFAEATKSILANVSAQALGMGLLHLGLGFAALTPWGAPLYGPAPAQFKSAAILLGIGAAMGGAARAIGGGGGKSDQSNSPDYQTVQSANIQSTNQNLGTGGTSQQQFNRLASAVNGLNQTVSTLSSAKPGEVLMKGMEQKRGAVSAQVNRELKSNSTAKAEMGKTLGLG